MHHKNSRMMKDCAATHAIHNLQLCYNFALVLIMVKGLSGIQFSL